MAAELRGVEGRFDTVALVPTPLTSSGELAAHVAAWDDADVVATRRKLVAEQIYSHETSYVSRHGA